MLIAAVVITPIGAGGAGPAFGDPILLAAGAGVALVITGLAIHAG